MKDSPIFSLLFFIRLILLLGFGLPLLSAAAVHYDLSFLNAAHHEADIRAVFSNAGSAPLTIVMSSSSPGRYALHEFAKNISNFRATDEAGQPLPQEHLSPDTWRVYPRGGTAVCSYTLFGDRADGTYAAIDETHAHLNMPATLVWARGWQDVPATLIFHLPSGSGWKVATQLKPSTDGSFSAPDLEYLMDSPVELSAFTMREWKWHNATFRLALHHRGTEAEADAFWEMCKKVVMQEEAVFGSLPHYDYGEYTFLADFLPYVSGDGMEHRNSTVMTASLDLANSSKQAVEIASHEFFHCWNVRRIRPESLEPFDFEHANMSKELWFAEGFTNYYGYLVLQRAGLASINEFLSEMGSAVNAVLNQPGHQVRSAADMSAMAPFVDAATSIDLTNRANDYISYYTYGEALALGIDLMIRSRYPGKSLDDWMGTMWRQHPDIDRTYTMNDLEQTLSETVKDEDFAAGLFNNSIQGIEPLNYKKLVEAAGLQLVPAKPYAVWLGASRLTPSDAGLALTGPSLRGSPLYLAGIDEGDELLNCAGEVLKTMNKLDECLQKHRPGDVLEFLVRTRSGTRTVNIKVAANPSLELKPVADGPLYSSTQVTFRSQWLSPVLRTNH